MAVAETIDTGPRLRAVSLCGVLIAAKVVLVAGLGLPVSGWSLWAWIWQDVFIALAFWAIDRVVNRAWAGWILYTATTAYIAINVPIARVLSSPLTPAMWHAAGSALDDSIVAGVTSLNVGSLLAVIIVAIALPLMITRRYLRHGRAILSAAIIVIAAGPWAAARVDTRGCDRNAVTALLWRRLPTAHAGVERADWRVSPIEGAHRANDAGAAPDLTRFHGAARRDNVLLIVLESAAAEYLKSYGADLDPMPHVTAFANRSIVFDNAYAVYPESIKSLFTTVCGRYPAFDTPVEAHATAPCASVATSFTDAGYRTALFHSGRFGYLGMDAMIAHKGFDVLEDAGAIGGEVHSSFGIDERSTVVHTLKWIDSLKPAQPFFVTYLPVAGHHPYVSYEPGPFPTDTDLNRYRNALHESDAAIGELLDGLRARALDGRTLVIIAGDHGEAFGQHAGNAGHTLFIFDENVRVPLMISVPGLTTGVRSSAIASGIDLAPTMRDLAGLPSSPLSDGTSLLTPGDRMALFFADYSLGFLGLRDGCWKDIFAIDSGRTSLFDVCHDPGEMHDLADSNAALTRAYRDRLQAWSVAVRKSLRE